ncbi:MAG TPA: hypothetical protein VMK82_06095 [Steroidobacteraceae bacterium]|nr:hypothetical protein [Steroidobacteraceae bacterium]
MELNAIFPAKCTWPEAIDDLPHASRDATNIRLVAKAKGIRELPLLRDLKALWCSDIDAAALEFVGECATLESLYIENLRADNIRALLKLKHLRILSIETCSRIDSIPDLESLHELRGLALTHFSKVQDLRPLGGLRRLASLAVAGSMWKRMNVSSFSPLRELRDLAFLHLTNIKAADESLEPLRGLSNLRQLDIANFYPTREFAKLARSLASTECTWFKPFVVLEFAKCAECGSRKVMPTGKGASSICPKCKKSKFEAHIAEWNEASRTTT